MRIGGLVAVAAIVVGAGCLVDSAYAQLMPGMRQPRSAADAARMAQGMACTLAAAGRPVEGLNAPISLKLEGVSKAASLPPALSSKFGALAAGSSIMSLDYPGGQIWLTYEPVTGKCAITGVADNLLELRAEMSKIFESERSSWRVHNQEAQGPYKQFDGRFDDKSGRGSAVELRATLIIPDQAGEQFLVVTQPFGQR